MNYSRAGAFFLIMSEKVFPPGQTLHIALAAHGFLAYLLDFCLVQQFYDLAIDRLSGNIFR